MKALRSLRSTRDTVRGLDSGFDRSVIVLGVLLSLLMAFTAGCSVAQDLASTTTVALAAPTTVASAAPTTVAPALPTTLVEQTTTTAQTTSTTQSPATTTTVGITTTTTTVSAEPAQPPAETALYEITDWSSGTSGWAAAGQWKTAGGMLVTDGSSDSFAVAPVDLTGYPDYVVECEVQIIDPKAGTDVALMARMVNGTGYWGGFDGSADHMVVGFADSELAASGFVLDSNWHTYRLEVRGNTVKLFFERAEVARAVDNRALEPGTVGIYCAGGQINVRSFKVIAL